ncbi:MAG TPA: TetR/AcrR family transcriptional regulator [Microlunatus sp.]|nr:TetR/AcrR family transcriptional regulator [Microlunatus sp.]
MLGETTSTWITDRQQAARRKILDAAWQVARTQGLAGLTLREVAAVVGIRPPSLYSHFESKHAIYDAMFGESWQQFLDLARGQDLPSTPRAALREIARTYFRFATADLARHQLMSLRTIPGFTPTPEAYAPAVASMHLFVTQLTALGLHLSRADIDLYTALIAGLVDQQWANDPGGDRWATLLDRAIDMYADNLDLTQEDR